MGNSENFRLVAICHDPRGGLLTLLDLEAAVVEAEAVRAATQEARKDLLLEIFATGETPKKTWEKTDFPNRKKQRFVDKK
jgi:gamma-glutamyl:cysteine ligase YbdK (ATP-grasp superfamily)